MPRRRPLRGRGRAREEGALVERSHCTISMVSRCAALLSCAKLGAVADLHSQVTDLPFKKGDIITILSQDDEEWWKGRIKLTEGLFPRNYVEAHFD